MKDIVRNTFKTIIELDNAIESAVGSEVVSYREVAEKGNSSVITFRFEDGRTAEVIIKNSTYDGMYVEQVYMA